ncbi:TIP-1 family-domain-containing protein [Cantharellus anzutake]|uniref:TIP-1 family-domain-containing protein n=1 Tax=Cantharellus anzutake TaxID=1750568 RepID=UPI001904BBED|nr:TIP-1 family-domain-containing protein [Cantharellus anzutake]KAF8340336.1 TIP-1 family-domain-containing protein [Cantharellus anzutake]
MAAGRFRQNSEGTGDEDLKPTTSARRIKGLIERVTEQYQPLPRFAHKAHFLITIQISILESYLSRISSSLDAYETLSSSFMKAVPGALAGQFGTVAYASAKWIKDAMENWGEELFFLELWAEINKRSALRARAVAHPSLPSNNIGLAATRKEPCLMSSLPITIEFLCVRSR